ETSKTPPTALHPKSTSISIADYPKLITVLRTAFRGTAQQGASLPILYGEYGVQTAIPFDKLGVYTNLGSSYAADAVSEARQGAYSVSGVRPDSDFFLWKITERYDDLGELGAALNGTPLAAWLETPYSYLATTKASEYTSARKARKIAPRESPYLVVYPFVKVRPWYALPEDERRRAMDEHIRIGREEFPTIHNHTTYSFGIDDQEFMTAFEC